VAVFRAQKNINNAASNARNKFLAFLSWEFFSEEKVCWLKKTGFDFFKKTLKARCQQSKFPFFSNV